MENKFSYVRKIGVPLGIAISLLTSPLHSADPLLEAMATPAFAKEQTLSQTSSKKPKGIMISLSDFGSEDLAYLSVPDNPPIGGLVLIHEWWGLNNSIKNVADEYADRGFVVVAIDLFNGAETTDPSRASRLVQDLRMDSAVKITRAGARFLRESPKFKVPKTACIGWSIGGSVSFNAALTVKELDAAVVYYGSIETSKDKLEKLKTPILGIFSATDKWLPATLIQSKEAELQALNKMVEFRFFDAPHSFANPESKNYNEIAKKNSEEIVLAFLNREFSKQEKKGSLLEKIF